MTRSLFPVTFAASLLVSSSLISLPVIAADSILGQIQTQWSVCQYQTLADDKESCLETLSKSADQQSQMHADRMDLLIWSAIVKSSYAGAKGGLGALSLVKEAKKELEKAISQDPNALDGSAYTSLGTLYYQVPGWPVGFGDTDKAEELLKKALTMNPTGIDPNFFYGDFLLEQGRKAEARQYLQKALAAPAREGRAVADQGRRAEIKARLEKL
jgi:tetratricopeptide (TPR) repeat protein